MFNYPQTCSKFLNDLPKKHKEVISRRFGLGGRKEKETLELIGKEYGITRERVRQIERDAISKLQPIVKKEQKVFQYFKEYLKDQGELKREDMLLKSLGGKKYQNQIYFLLVLGDNFSRIAESEDLYALWTINKGAIDKAKRAIVSLCKKLEKMGKPLKLKDLDGVDCKSLATLNSYLEASKRIQQNGEGLFGLREWPEINPRGVKDKAYLVFKKEDKPLHFREVASLIEKSLPQTVHNELIKDQRFVLVGRGLYALREWGHEEGPVKDVIAKILADAGQSLSRKDILDKVLKQRVVKENTVLLNLSNKEHFFKDSEGFYTINKKTHLA